MAKVRKKSKIVPQALAVAECEARTARGSKRQLQDQGSEAASKRIRARTPDIKMSSEQPRISTIVRHAEPHRTNAPLVTPRGSRVVAYPRNTPEAALDTGIPKPTTTTDNMLNEACEHLIRMDPKLKPLIDKHYCNVFCPEGLAEECDPFRSLCSGITGQQVSGAAAASIKRKFIALFQDTDSEKHENQFQFPTPLQVACCSVPFLRQAGLSERKAEYIKGLAQKFVDGDLSATMLINASDEEVLERLIAVRGLGRWSVEMFACFGLKRMDIFSTGDLGVQ